MKFSAFSVHFLTKFTVFQLFQGAYFTEKPLFSFDCAEIRNIFRESPCADAVTIQLFMDFKFPQKLGNWRSIHIALKISLTPMPVMAYSVDLRMAAVKHYPGSGDTLAEAGTIFGVSATSVERWVDRYEETGGVANKPLNMGFKKIDPAKFRKPDETPPRPLEYPGRQSSGLASLPPPQRPDR